MNHTPGPWNYGEKIAYGHDIKNHDTSIWIANVNRCNYMSNPETVLANARLIAAAPEMLEALIDAYKIIRRHENPDLPGSAELRAIKSIIERATGRKIEEVIG